MTLPTPSPPSLQPPLPTKPTYIHTLVEYTKDLGDKRDGGHFFVSGEYMTIIYQGIEDGHPR